MKEISKLKTLREKEQKLKEDIEKLSKQIENKGKEDRIKLHHSIENERGVLTTEWFKEGKLSMKCHKCKEDLEIYGTVFKPDVMDDHNDIIIEGTCKKCEAKLKHQENIRLKNAVTYVVIPKKISTYNAVHKGHPL